MNNRYKIFVILVIFIIGIFSTKLYIENLNSKTIKNISIQYEAKSIADFLVAFRKTYQDIFLQDYVKLDKSNIDFLPVKTTNEIAKQFSLLDTQTKIQTVSDNPRNPLNMANKRQLEAINLFKKDKKLKYLFKKVGDSYYYSQPLYITKSCLKCHGEREKAPAIIRNNYKRAYNYKMNDLRGIIDIELHQTKLSQLLNYINNKRFSVVLIFLILLIVILFLYIRCSYNLELKIKQEMLNNSQKDKLRVQQEAKQKEYLHTVIESNNNAIIAIDRTQTILTFNKKAQEIFGFTQEEMIGSKNLLKIIPLKYKNLHTVASELYFKTGKSKNIINQTMELEGLSKDNKIIPIRMSFGASKNQDIVVGNITDISNEKKQEKIIQQQSRLAQMGEMIGMIAHQWRQPLTAISTASIAINMKAQMDILDNKSAIELAEKISEFTQHLSKTIDDFREFYKDKKEKQDVTYKELINSTLEIVEVSLKNKNIALVIEMQSEITFHTYANELKQVLLNLIKNAEDALLEKGVENPYIKIITQENKLTVSDNGGGIPKDIIEKIFDPYFSTKKKLNGTGLGLYMSKTIIEEHCEGKLSVHNEEDGAVFVVELSN